MYHKPGLYLKLMQSKDDRDDHINLYENYILLFYILMFFLLFTINTTLSCKQFVFSNAIFAICCRIHRSSYLKLAGNPSQSDVIVEGKNYVNGYYFCNRLSPKQNFVSLHHTIIWRKAAFVCWFQRVPTKCGADLRAYLLLFGWLNQARKLSL